MALVTKNFTLNVTPGAIPPIIHVSEYDIGRAFNVTFIGENRNAFEIPTGTTATVEGTLNGTVGFTTSATISNNQITFALTESMTAYAGRAWCKIKLTLNSEPIQTCAFILAVDRAGVEADTVIGAPGFEQQIVNAVNDWLDEHPPAAGGMTEEFKQALLDCFENVAWINADGQTYYDALYAALYPPVDVLSISAVFTQGSAVIYDTDDLDTLRQYLVVTATMTDSTTQTVTNYTLSGSLTEGTSTITVSYGGKTTTFTVEVSEWGGDSGAIYSIQNQTYLGEHASTVTDVYLLSNVTDYLIIADVTYSGTQGNNSYVFSLLSANQRMGLRMDINNNRQVTLWATDMNSVQTGINATDGTRVKVAMFHKAGESNVISLYCAAQTQFVTYRSTSGADFVTDYPLYAAGADFYGTIHSLAVFNSLTGYQMKVINLFGLQAFVFWELGSISGASGNFGDSTTRARTPLLLGDSVTSITVSSGYEILIYAWDGNANYVGAWTGSGWATSASYMSSVDFETIKTAYPTYGFRLMLRNKTNPNATITVEEAYNNVTFA